jgi:hypothetical protein
MAPAPVITPAGGGGGQNAASSSVKEGAARRASSHPWSVRFKSIESLGKVKQGLTHVGLFALFITYTVIGGKV